MLSTCVSHPLLTITPTLSALYHYLSDQAHSQLLGPALSSLAQSFFTIDTLLLPRSVPPATCCSLQLTEHHSFQSWGPQWWQRVQATGEPPFGSFAAPGSAPFHPLPPPRPTIPVLLFPSCPVPAPAQMRPALHQPLPCNQPMHRSALPASPTCTACPTDPANKREALSSSARSSSSSLSLSSCTRSTCGVVTRTASMCAAFTL